MAGKKVTKGKKEARPLTPRTLANGDWDLQSLPKNATKKKKALVKRANTLLRKERERKAAATAITTEPPAQPGRGAGPKETESNTTAPTKSPPKNGPASASVKPGTTRSATKTGPPADGSGNAAVDHGNAGLTTNYDPPADVPAMDPGKSGPPGTAPTAGPSSKLPTTAPPKVPGVDSPRLIGEIAELLSKIGAPNPTKYAPLSTAGSGSKAAGPSTKPTAKPGSVIPGWYDKPAFIDRKVTTLQNIGNIRRFFQSDDAWEALTREEQLAIAALAPTNPFTGDEPADQPLEHKLKGMIDNDGFTGDVRDLMRAQRDGNLAPGWLKAASEAHKERMAENVEDEDEDEA